MSVSLSLEKQIYTGAFLFLILHPVMDDDPDPQYLRRDRRDMYYEMS